MSKNKWLTKLNDDWGVIASQLEIKKPAVVATPSQLFASSNSKINLVFSRQEAVPCSTTLLTVNSRALKRLKALPLHSFFDLKTPDLRSSVSFHASCTYYPIRSGGKSL
jgi:hypothetical protein